MNVLKNFEALFVVTLGLACAFNYVLDTDVATESQPVAVRAAAPSFAARTATDMQVIVISAKRMTSAQKVQSLIDERNAASASIAGTSKI